LAQLKGQYPVLTLNPQTPFKEIRMNFNKNLGLLLLGIWLILSGIVLFVSLGDIETIKNVLALVAGILIIIGR
jgi:hypothetical protein